MKKYNEIYRVTDVGGGALPRVRESYRVIVSSDRLDDSDHRRTSLYVSQTT